MISVHKLYIDDQSMSLTPAPRLKNDEVLVPLQAFGEAVGVEVKFLDSSGRLAICRGDRCLSLDINGADVVSIDGVVYASLATFAKPLGFSWRMEDGALQVTSSAIDHIGLSIGDYPPDFTLPDLYAGESVSLRDYLGKKAVFFMWATW